MIAHIPHFNLKSKLTGPKVTLKCQSTCLTHSHPATLFQLLWISPPQIPDSSTSSPVCTKCLSLSPVLSGVHSIPQTSEISTGMLRRFLASCPLLSDHQIGSSDAGSHLFTSVLADNGDGESVILAESKFKHTDEPVSTITIFCIVVMYPLPEGCTPQSNHSLQPRDRTGSCIIDRSCIC